MSYQVLSLKYRPQVFDELVGQEHVSRTLQNAIANDRVAHAYIFTGARGVGKTTTARLLAKTLNCAHPDGSNPCNKCTACEEITRGNSFDVLEIDGASNRGIDEIRDLREAVKYPPISGHFRIYIIDEVHMLTTPAFNALLKTLEEPPDHVKFIMATTDPQKVPQTILSRTQRFDFKRIPTQDLATYLGKILDGEKLQYDSGALLLLARKADGSVRDGLSLLDQVIAYQGDKITDAAVMTVLGLIDDSFFDDLLRAIAGKDRKGVLVKVDEMFDGGYDIQEVCHGLVQYLRDAILTLESGDPHLTSKGTLVTVPEDLATADLISLQNIGLDTVARLRYSQQPRVLLEHQLLKMVELDRVVSIQGLLENLEKKSLQSMADTPKPAPKPAPVDKPVKTVSPPAAAAMETDTSHGGQSTQFEATEAATAVQVAEGTSPAHKSQAIDAINEHWTEIITAVEKNSRNAAALLEGSQVAELIDSRLTINLPDSEPIHLNMLRERRDLIEAAIEKVTGHRISVLLTIPETGSRVEHITKKTEHSALLEELIDTFKGEEY